MPEALGLELRGQGDVVLAWGNTFVIPAGERFRGYRWARDPEEPCVFVAVSAADEQTTGEPMG